MRRSGIFGILAALAFLPLVGCAGVEYRQESTVSYTRYATVENFGDITMTAEQVDGLIEEVAGLLNVTLDPRKPKVRIMVVSPSRISEVYRQLVTVTAHGSDVAALYLPGAGVVMVPSFERSLVGHELAHYMTDQYLKSTPKSQWERIALRVESQIASAPVVAKAALPRDAVARADQGVTAASIE
jgi:hypothetical protein